jgi:hypothetical protein
MFLSEALRVEAGQLALYWAMRNPIPLRPTCIHQTMGRMGIEGLIELMAYGVREHARLLAAALPRVSSEGLVVAVAVEALLADGKASSIKIEQKRRDLEVTIGDETYELEFKPLWPWGLGENTGGIKADLDKLAGFTNGFSIAFAYIFEEVPDGTLRPPRGDLDTLVTDAIERVGARPVAQSETITIRAHQCVAKVRLIAWKASS